MPKTQVPNVPLNWPPQNMDKAGEAKIKEQTEPDFTRVTFNPDLERFSMESLNEDTVALLSRSYLFEFPVKV